MLGSAAKHKLKEADRIKDTAENLLDKVYDTLHEQMDVIQDYYEETKDITQETTKKVKKFVQKHPFYSALGAAVVGVALGIAAKREDAD